MRHGEPCDIRNCQQTVVCLGEGERGAHHILAPLALAVVVVDVDRVLQVWHSSGDFIDRVHHEVQHVLPVLEGIGLAPGHVLHTAVYIVHAVGESA